MPLEHSSALATLLVAVDPLGLCAIFLALTRGLSVKARNAVAAEACFVAFAILACAALFGERLLAYLGIDIASFRIAGGLLLFVIAFEMVFDTRQRRKESDAAPDAYSHPAVFPLAIPLLAGPGAITASILIASRAPQSWMAIATLIGLIALVMAISYGAFRMAPAVGYVIGERGQIVFSRVLGVLLAALAVQYVVEGVLYHARQATMVTL